MGWTQVGTSAAEAALFEGLPEILSLPSSSGASLYHEVSRLPLSLWVMKLHSKDAALSLYSRLCTRELPGYLYLHPQCLRVVLAACSVP